MTRGRFPSLPQKCHPFNRTPQTSALRQTAARTVPVGLGGEKCSAKDRWGWKRHILRPRGPTCHGSIIRTLPKKEKQQFQEFGMKNFFLFLERWGNFCLRVCNHPTRYSIYFYFCRLMKKNFELRERHWEVKCFNTIDFIQGFYLYTTEQLEIQLGNGLNNLS